jgi:predicted MarR family transcription regulator
LFSYDLQAITDAFYFDTFATMERTQELSEQGVEAAREANRVMQRVRVSGQEAQAGIDELARKSSEINRILETIAGIANQANRRPPIARSKLTRPVKVAKAPRCGSPPAT